MPDTTEAVPKDAPWLGDWKTVAKAAGNYQEPPKEEGVVTKVVRAIRPWLMEWGVIAKQADNLPAPIQQVPKEPARVDVSTEANLKKAVVIQPHERQPDTQSLASNLAEIDQEIKNTKDKKARDILIQHRATMVK